MEADPSLIPTQALAEIVTDVIAPTQWMVPTEQLPQASQPPQPASTTPASQPQSQAQLRSAFFQQQGTVGLSFALALAGTGRRKLKDISGKKVLEGVAPHPISQQSLHLIVRQLPSKVGGGRRLARHPQTAASPQRGK